MISAFQSHDVGWGMEITQRGIDRINEMWKGQYYFDVDAAKAVNDCAMKPNLGKSPFVATFEFGGSKGYWNSNHIIQQVEDVHDCMLLTLCNCFEYCYLFDHGSGHAKKRENGLDAKKMNVKWVRESFHEKHCYQE